MIVDIEVISFRIRLFLKDKHLHPYEANQNSTQV